MDKEKLAKALTKALGYTENGGKPNLNNPKSGKTGEMKSIFQFTPDTWKNDAKQVLGNENAPMNADTEAFVVHKKVTDWLKKGYTIKQIASMWNAGVGEPDAYGGKFSDGSPSVGRNKKYGVPFDVPSYANKVEQYTNQFMSGQSSETPPPQSQVNSTQPNDPLNSVLTSMKGAQSQATTGPTPSATSGIIQQLIQGNA